MRKISGVDGIEKVKRSIKRICNLYLKNQEVLLLDDRYFDTDNYGSEFWEKIDNAENRMLKNKSEIFHLLAGAESFDEYKKMHNVLAEIKLMCKDLNDNFCSWLFGFNRGNERWNKFLYQVEEVENEDGLIKEYQTILKNQKIVEVEDSCWDKVKRSTKESIFNRTKARYHLCGYFPKVFEECLKNNIVAKTDNENVIIVKYFTESHLSSFYCSESEVELDSFWSASLTDKPAGISRIKNALFIKCSKNDLNKFVNVGNNTDFKNQLEIILNVGTKIKFVKKCKKDSWYTYQNYDYYCEFV